LITAQGVSELRAPPLRGLLRLFLLPALLGLSGYALASPCAEAISVEGDPELAAALRALLSERGFDGCVALVVRVERGGDGLLALTLKEPSGRQSERRVEALTTAAAVIEVRARGDLRDLILSLEQPRGAAPRGVSAPPAP
jgi:hypothetical protein